MVGVRVMAEVDAADIRVILLVVWLGLGLWLWYMLQTLEGSFWWYG